MLEAIDLELQYGGRVLFRHADLKFTNGNCYGIIGANGAGKSTLLKILSGEIEPTGGRVEKTPSERISILRQNHFEFDEYTALRTVLMGNKELCDIIDEKERLYAKADMTDEEGLYLCDLESKFAEMDGWGAESEAEILLNNLGITNEYHYTLMKELTSEMKVKVLLAQALFGNPDILMMDEPTNHLDLDTVAWLEEFLIELDSIVLVVSHDRHFLNKVCTHIVDVDYGKITMIAGNYDFWYEYTQIRQRQIRDQNKKNEQKVRELQEFISRFSANASKSKQATSRKKTLESINVAEMPVSSRKFPYIAFKPNREIGNEVLQVTDLCKKVGDRTVLDHVSFTIRPDDKVAFVGGDAVIRATLFGILAEEIEPDSGTIRWGVTTSRTYVPSDNSAYFDGCEDSLTDWIRNYSNLTYEMDVRSWLGRMLFSGEEATKKAKVLSGGERVRCMMCKAMLSGANVIMMDEPTNHLDLESIAALNEGLMKFSETVLFSSHDHQFVQTVANRIIDLTPGAFFDRPVTLDEYLEMRRKEVASV